MKTANWKKEANNAENQIILVLETDAPALAGIPLYSLVVLVVYSFNESKLVTVWGGFSTKWYGALMENDTILEAAWLSLRIAIVSSLAAVALGTLAGYAMARIKRFRGSTPVCRYDFRAYGDA